MVDEDEISEQMKMFANGMKEAAPEMAELARAQFEAFVEAGFDEDQAMELLKHFDAEANFQR